MAHRRPLAVLFFLFSFASSLILSPPAAAQDGVLVDAEGVLRLRKWEDPGGKLHRTRIAAAKAELDQKIAVRSKLRKVSLNRLEAAIAAALDANRRPTDAMLHLAGLTRVQYVFFYPETKDIVLAGPAEGWVEDVSGRVVGMKSGRPVLELRDLIVALRTYGLGPQAAPIVSVSIEPSGDGLVRMQKYLARLGNVQPSDDRRIAFGLKQSLGQHDVLVRGIPANTHFARVLVEADYRMKLIGIGLETPPVKIASYVSKAKPADVARNAMQRWYFVPNYECVRLSNDGLAMELVGEGVKLVGEQEVVGAGGVRRAAGRESRASQLFCRSFTKHYAKLAAQVPVYAQMRNLIDLCIAAAHIREQGLVDAADWKLEVFGDEERFAVQNLAAPRKVGSAVNVVWKGNTLMTPIGGGVRIEAVQALDENHLLTDKTEQVEKAHAQIDPAALPKDRWWWD